MCGPLNCLPRNCLHRSICTVPVLALHSNMSEGHGASSASRVLILPKLKAVAQPTFRDGISSPRAFFAQRAEFSGGSWKPALSELDATRQDWDGWRRSITKGSPRLLYAFPSILYCSNTSKHTLQQGEDWEMQTWNFWKQAAGSERTSKGDLRGGKNTCKSIWVRHMASPNGPLHSTRLEANIHCNWSDRPN